MLFLRIAPGAAVFAAATGIALAASGPSLAVKPGLWEMTTTVKTQGAMMPPDVYDQMPPAQRAQIEARMNAQQPPRTKRHCVTQADIDKGFDLDDGTRGQCTSTIVSASRTALVVNMRCRSNRGGTSTGTMHYSTSDGTTVAGRFDMKVTASANNVMTIKGTMSGRWLGADCGTVKPRGAR